MKRVLSAFIALLLFMALVGCSAKQPEATLAETTEAATKAPFDIERYKDDVSACADRIGEESIVIYNVAKKELDYIKISANVGNKVGSEKALETAIMWLEEKSDYSMETIAAGYQDISGMYKTIIATEIDGPEAEEIKSVFDEYATAYITLYGLAMAPSGDAGSFADDCDDCIDTLRICQSKLEILLS